MEGTESSNLNIKRLGLGRGGREWYKYAKSARKLWACLMRLVTTKRIGGDFSWVGRLGYFQQERN